jgi:hypothetical protein
VRVGSSVPWTGMFLLLAALRGSSWEDSAVFRTSEEDLMMTLVWTVWRLPQSPSLTVTVSVRSKLVLSGQSWQIRVDA